LLSTLCNFVALRETPDLHEKQTRITSVTYQPSKDTIVTNTNKANHHNTRFFDTKSRDSHSYASPEGHEATPSEKYQRGPNTRPLGAAMRLTALRHSPTYISRQPKNSGHPKTTPKPQNGSCPQIFCNHKLIPSGTEESENAGMRAASYDSVHAPGIHACSHPLSKLITLGA
jgi:hypothetical protein